MSACVFAGDVNDSNRPGLRVLFNLNKKEGGGRSVGWPRGRYHTPGT